MIQRIILLSTTLFLMSCSGKPPTDMGVLDHRLKGCSNKHNCVSSFAGAPYFVGPIKVLGKPTQQDVMNRLRVAGSAVPGAQLVKIVGNYLYFEVKSPILHFVDDMEIYYDAEAGYVHFRSASRLGFYDFGANRRHFESFVAKLKSEYGSDFVSS